MREAGDQRRATQAGFLRVVTRPLKHDLLTCCVTAEMGCTRMVSRMWAIAVNACAQGPTWTGAAFSRSFLRAKAECLR